MLEFRLTEKEAELISSWLKASADSCGAKVIKDFMEDNYTYLNIYDLVECTHFTIPQIKGLISSLLDKDCIISDCDIKDLFFISYGLLEVFKDLKKPIEQLTAEDLM